MGIHRSAPLALVLMVGAAACGGIPSTGVATPVPSEEATSTAVVPSGPSPYADWVALQGFGGGSGIAGLTRAPRFLRDHLHDPGFDLTSWAEVTDRLVRWLLDHQSVSCWADYHDAVLERLKVVAADFVALRSLADAGDTLTVELIDQLERDVTAANAIPSPVACD